MLSCIESNISQLALKHLVSSISVSTLKQCNAAANWLQRLQHMVLTGSLTEQPISQNLLVKENYKVRKATDHVRRIRAGNDAAEGGTMSLYWQVSGCCDSIRLPYCKQPYGS